MIIGILRELKPDEYRVAGFPMGVAVFIQVGYKVLEKTGAGEGNGFDVDEKTIVAMERTATL